MNRSQLLPPGSSCAALARVDPSVTNGALWGTTILPGLGAPGGWFGVPVCANGLNLVAPGGANVSCDALPARFAASGCVPGTATDDGYGWSFQCVELVARFVAWAYGDAPAGWRGDAPYLWLKGHHPADFTTEGDGVSLQAPQPGDILVWGSLDSQGQPWPAGPAGGHVAVVATVGGGQITFVEENMLGHRGAEAINIPSETTTLTRSASGAWSLGATYGLNGGRVLYGWLHSARNTGHFPRRSAAGTTSATPTPTPTVAPSVAPTTTSTIAASSGAPSSSASTPPLPSLAQGVIITGAGTLAETVWSDTHTPERPPSPQTAQPDGASIASATDTLTPAAVGSTVAGAAGADAAASTAMPQAMVESLGAPPGQALAPKQAPAVVALPTGERYIFARGQDGALYAAYTPAQQPGVFWQALGAPPGVTLTSQVTASWDGTELLAGALGADGAFWLRVGPAGMLGGWVSLGHPTGVAFRGNPLLLSAVPPAATPSATVAPVSSPSALIRQALAVGVNGALYVATWQPAAAASPTTTTTPTATSDSANGKNSVSSAQRAGAPGWSDWSPVAPAPTAAPLAGSLILATDAATTAGPAIVLAPDATGRLLLFHVLFHSIGAEQSEQTWSELPISAPVTSATPTVALAATLGSIAMSGGTAGGQTIQTTQQTLHIYLAAAQPSGAASSALPAATPAASPAEGGDASGSMSHTSPSPPATAPLGVAARHQTTGLTPPAPSLPVSQVILEGSLTLDLTNGALTASGAAAWSTLGIVSPASTASVATSASASISAPTLSSAIALDLRADGSAVLLAQGNALLLLGNPAAMHLLAPEPNSAVDVAPQPVSSVSVGASAGAAAPSMPLVVGVVAGPATFSDPFAGAALDPRWLVAAAPISSVESSGMAGSTAAQEGQGTLTLSTAATATRQMTTATQGVPTGDFTVTAHVVPGAGWASDAETASGKQAGLLLQLDEWNQLTLSLRADNTVALCGLTSDTSGTTSSIAGQAPWCNLIPLPAGAAFAQGIWLRLTQTGAMVAGQVSADKTQWTTVGNWSIVWTRAAESSGTAGAVSGAPAPSSTTTTGVESTPSATGHWLSYTSMGLFVSDIAAPPPGSPAKDQQSQLSAQFSAFSLDVG